ncbi:uncharacterized protein LOC129635110 isoform X4 [Bubalus kerabau]|uniref:uncharacterized protein LOC129635110 isoform X4 n=1 Tax=Bubalus carabanensis TaxID=3119969 RepID=UPI00244EEB17|nr:uncharacterized protein LOC129635110 isoform X4 [Bubalus carabanensis]
MEAALACHTAMRTAPDLTKCLSSYHGSKLFSSLPWYFLFILKFILNLISDFRQTVKCIQKLAPENTIQSVPVMQKPTAMNVLSAMKRSQR